MRIIASVQAKRGSLRGLVHYIAHSKLDIEREPEKGRELFNGFTDDLTVESANNSLKMGIAKARPPNDELHHLVLSFRPSDYQVLGRDEKARRRALKHVTRAAMTRLETALSAERLSWAAAVHLNTENPHVHIALQKQYFTKEIERQILTRIPREALPHFEHRDDEKVLVPGFFIEAATEKMEQLIAHDRQQLPARFEDTGTERERDADARQNTAREREILRHGFLAEYELHRVETKISDLIERGDKMRFLVSDRASGRGRRLSLRDIEQQKANSDTSPKSPPEVQIRTILSKMLAKEETAKVKLQNDTADLRREANRLKARYRQNDWKLPSPSFTKDELDKLQNHYLQASNFRKFTYLEGVRSELERSGEIGPRDKDAIGRIAADKLISELRGKVHRRNYLDLSERRYYSLAEIPGKRISLAQLDREENASVNPVVKFVQHLKKSVSRLSETGRTSPVKIENDRIRDEIMGRLGERLAGIERDRKTEQKKAMILEKILTVESGEPPGEPVYSAEQLAEIESLSSRLKLRAIHENNRDEQRKFIESAKSDCHAYRKALKCNPSADFEEHKRTVIAGRALAREIVAKVEFERARDDLKTFSESKRFQKFAIADKDTGSLIFLSLHDVDLPRRNSILDRAIDEIFESHEHRSLRRTITSLVKAREQRLKDDFDGARGILTSASREASEFTHSSLFGLRSEPMYRPIFTTSEIAAIEIRAANTLDAREAARLRKVLESTADRPQQRSPKDILRDFESPSMSYENDRKHDPAVRKISDRSEVVVQEQVSGKPETLKEPKLQGYLR